MSYYDLNIGQIPIGWSYRPEIVEMDGKRELSVPVQVEEHDLEWWLDKWKTHVGDYPESDAGHTLCRIKFTDNGDCGDGIVATIFAGDEKHELAQFAIPDESLGTLIETLTAIKRLRKVQ